MTTLVINTEYSTSLNDYGENLSMTKRNPTVMKLRNMLLNAPEDQHGG